MPREAAQTLGIANNPNHGGWATLGWGTMFSGLKGTVLPQLILTEAPGLAILDPANPAALNFTYYFNLFDFDGTSFVRTAWPEGQQRRADRGAAILYLDGDGRPDLLGVCFGTTGPVVWRNGYRTGSVLTVKLKGNGKTVPRQGVGARVRVKVKDAVQGQELQLGGQFTGGKGELLYFGLGEAGMADEVRVLWPDGGAPTVLSGVPAGALTIAQP